VFDGWFCVCVCVCALKEVCWVFEKTVTEEWKGDVVCARVSKRVGRLTTTVKTKVRAKEVTRERRKEKKSSTRKG